jgi:hypothetical protein
MARARTAAWVTLRLLAECLYLAGKNFVKPVIVGNANDGGGVVRQRDGGQARAVAAETSHQLARHMLRVGGATAVAAPQYFVALYEGARHAVGNLLQSLALAFELMDHAEVSGDGFRKYALQVQQRQHACLSTQELRGIAATAGGTD